MTLPDLAAPTPAAPPDAGDPPDAAARRRIRSELDRTLFVSAGAGSGKTSMLVDRVLALVLDKVAAVPMRHIAAITFTEKAATELRDRLRRELERLARTGCFAGVPLDADGRDRATAALAELDSAAISTLHSFAQRLLLEHPLDADLPPALDVLDDIESEVEFEARNLAARKIIEIEREVKEDADRRARKILATTIQRIASDYVAETTISVIALPSDDMKGRIIGREGRNIRALEQATGVDLIVDDTPEAVTISAFDPVRREVARRALGKLLQDGRIHPTRIEEIVAKTRLELEQVMREEGEKVAYEANVPGLHPDLIKLLGRLKYRTSYGQNVLAHSLETSLIAAALAAEIGADVNVAKTAGLLHDIGKAVDHEVEGPHALIGADIAKRLGRSSKIVHAIAAHHGEEEPQTVEAFIVATSDAISGARPGARREMVETYIKRLEALEGVANSFDGVEKSFAIQAGREVRILVHPESIDDLGAARLARDVSKKIEESLEYPGQIKVTVIRETRAVDYAR